MLIGSVATYLRKKQVSKFVDIAAFTYFLFNFS